MPDTPAAGAALTDDEFLAMVDEDTPAETDPADRTAALESTAPDATDDESGGTSTESEDIDNAAAESEERTDEVDEQPAAATSAAAVPAASAPAPAAPAPAAPGLPSGVPFQYKAAGGTHVLPGALELPDGSVVIPKEARAEHLRRLASERELSANFRKTQGQFARELAAAKAARSAKDVEAEMVYKLFGDVKAMTPEERWDYFQKFDEEAPKLELDIQRRQLAEERAAIEAARRAPEPTPEERQEARTALLTSELSKSYYGFAERLKTVPGGELITPDEYNRVFQKWARYPDRLVSIEGDQEMFNDAEIGDDLALLIEAKQAARKGLVAAAAGTTAGAAGAAAGGTAGAHAAPSPAAARNAALNADRNPIPPVVQTGRVPKDGAKGKGLASYKGKSKQWARDFALGKLDADDE